MTARENTVGAWAFLLGIILAVAIGISASLFPIPFVEQYSAQMYAILVLIGLFVGYVNTMSRDPQTFLIAGAVLVIVSKFGMDSVTGNIIGIGVGEVVSSIFGALLILFVPTTIVVAIKTVFAIARI